MHLSGDLTLDTSTLKVDSSNNKLSIISTSISDLDVSGGAASHVAIQSSMVLIGD